MPIEPLPARLFLSCGAAAAVASAIFYSAPALWPAPFPEFSALFLAILIAITGAFGTFENIDGLAEYTSLAMPIGLAAALVLDWRHYLLCIAIGEFLQFVSERTRNINPTKWYVRCFNVCGWALAGFGASLIVTGFWPVVRSSLPDGWGSPVLFMALACATLTWQATDEALTWILVTLAAALPLASIEFSTRRFLARYYLILAGVPFGYVFHANLWIALMTLGPLSKGLGLLGLSELEHRGQTDARTGLFNAGRFDELLGTALEDARQDGKSVALVIADIDNFKSINDLYGHPAGDKVITRIAAVLDSMTRTNDVAARIGGEEFAVILSGNDREDALSFAERVRRRVAEEPFEGDGAAEPLSITTSVGVAFFPTDAQTPAALYASADAALYEAKRGGRNRVCSAGKRP